ncbi:MAG TPA: MFS transporter [Candidatus Polarisedimenticolia bacterium]|jgi:MFS family permease|nr:MFS transporter [Candidatus Polarisedimenticolia bacterium]
MIGESAKSRKAQALAQFLGLKRGIVGMLSMAVLVGMGENMAEQFLPLYLLALGGGFLSVGVLNGMDNLLGALYSFPGGYLSDRLGTKRALLLFNLLSMAGFALVIAVPAWPAVLGGATMFLSWSAISLPATMGLVAKALPPDKRTMGVSLHSLVRRVPMALGPLMGGLFISWWGVERGVRLAFVAALAMAIVAAILQQRLIEDDHGGEGGKPPAQRNPFRMWSVMNGDLKRLLAADILVRFCEQIPYAFVVIWAVGAAEAGSAHSGPVSPVQFGVLRTIEMATAALIYVPVAYFADRSRKKPFVALTFLFFTLFPLVLLFSRSFEALILAFVLRGLKEFGEPTRKSMILELAPEGRKAGTFGLYYLVRDLVVSVAAFGGAFLWSIGPEVNLLTAFAFGAAGTLWFLWKGKDLGRDGSGPEREPLRVETLP